MHAVLRFQVKRNPSQCQSTDKRADRERKRKMIRQKNEYETTRNRGQKKNLLTLGGFGRYPRKHPFGEHKTCGHKQSKTGQQLEKNRRRKNRRRIRKQRQQNHRKQVLDQRVTNNHFSFQRIQLL